MHLKIFSENLKLPNKRKIEKLNIHAPKELSLKRQQNPNLLSDFICCGQKPKKAFKIEANQKSNSENPFGQKLTILACSCSLNLLSFLLFDHENALQKTLKFPNIKNLTDFTHMNLLFRIFS